MHARPTEAENDNSSDEDSIEEEILADQGDSIEAAVASNDIEEEDNNVVILKDPANLWEARWEKVDEVTIDERMHPRFPPQMIWDPNEGADREAIDYFMHFAMKRPVRERISHMTIKTKNSIEACKCALIYYIYF